jgi:hypothetical protein
MRFGRSGAFPQWAAAAGLLAGVAVALPASAQSTIRPGWGFNWRLKERASCRLIDTSVLPICSQCREMPNAYRSGIDAQACFMVPKFEYVIFPTEVDCQKGLELMKGGGSP